MTTYVCKVYAFREKEGRAGVEVKTSQSRNVQKTDKNGYAIVILDNEISSKADIYVNGSSEFSDYCSNVPDILPVSV